MANLSSVTSLSGLGSGLDTTTIVSQLVALRRQPATKLGYQMDVIQARHDGLQEVSNLLSALRSQSQSLSSDALWSSSQSVSSSDSAIVGVSRNTDTAAGSHTLQVLGLARAEQQRSAATFLGVPEDDVLHIALGSATPTSISLLAGDTLQTVADKVNAVAGSNIFASVVNERLYFSGKTAGAANNITVSSDNSTASTMGLTASISAADASYKLNGGATQTSTSNTVTDAIAGLSLSLKQVGTATIAVSESATSAENLASKVSDWVDAYNQSAKGIRERVTAKPASKPTTTAGRQQGALFNDSTLQATQSSLRTWSTRTVSGVDSGYDSLSELGITTAAGGAVVGSASSGQLSFDRAKFLAAYAANPAQVKLALNHASASSASEGLAQWSEKQINLMIGSTGTVAAAIKGQNSEKTIITDRQARINERADRYSAQLTRQFNAMETAMSTLNSQGSNLNAQILKLG